MASTEKLVDLFNDYYAGSESTMANQAFVVAAYEKLLGLTGDFSDKDARVKYWVDQLEDGDLTRGDFAADFLHKAANVQGDLSDAQFEQNKKVVAALEELDEENLTLNNVAGAAGSVVDSSTDGETPDPVLPSQENIFTLTEVTPSIEKTFLWDGVDTGAIKQLIEYAQAYQVAVNGSDQNGDSDLAIDGDFTGVGDNFGEAYLEDMDDWIRDYPSLVDEQVEFNPAVLTTSANNEGVMEVGYTQVGVDNHIIAGTSYALHGAYIDGGDDSYNTLEVDMKGPFAQAKQLLNIQEVQVQNLTNYYEGLFDYNNGRTEDYNDNATNDYDNGSGDDASNVQGGEESNPGSTGLDDFIADQGNNSVLDLSRASDLEKLVVTESGSNGTLTVLGIKNYATARLEGGFDQDVTLHYTQGQGNELNLELANVSFSETFNIAHNVGRLVIDSQGYSNILNDVSFGSHFQQLEVNGSGVLAIEDDLAFAFNEAHIDASGNTGGLRLKVSSQDSQGQFGALEEITIKGSQGRDVLDINSAADTAVLLNIDTGVGRDTVKLNAALDAGEGSVITGENLTVEVAAAADLREADVSGVNSFVLTGNGGLYLTQAQVSELGAAAFVAEHDGVKPVLTVHISEADTQLSELIDLAALDSDVKLAFDIDADASLDMTAEELHTYLSEDGVAGEGTVNVSNAGLGFDAADNSAIGNGVGSVEGNFEGDLNVVRSADGFERPALAGDTDKLVIDTADTATVDANDLSNVDNDEAYSTAAKTVIIKGENDITFNVPVEMLHTKAGDAAGEGFTLDFSELTGSLNGLTLQNFDQVENVLGNGADDVRIDVALAGNVGTAGAANGLESEDVAQYVVTDMTDAAGNPASHTFFVCDKTQDLDVIGLQGNSNQTLTIGNVPWGAVNPTILFEGDGFGNWDQLPKAAGNPDASSVGTIVADYFYDGAPAKVLITNQGVAPGQTSTGADRPIVVDGIVLDNATSLNVTVQDGDAVISSIADNGAGSGLDDVTLTSANDVTLHLDGDSLESIDASAVDGTATLQIEDDTDFSDTALTGVEAVVLEDNVTATLTIEQIDAIGVANITHADFDDAGDEAILNVAGLAEQEFSLPAGSAEGVNLGAVVIAEQDSVTLNAATDLTGAASVQVPAGTTVTMTAAQFMQFATYDADGNVTVAPVVSGAGTLNITGLTQAIVDAGFSLDQVTATEGQITLAEDVVLDTGTDLGGASIELADSQTITMATVEQAHAREVTVADGAADTTVGFDFTTSADGDEATGYDFDEDGNIGNADGVEFGDEETAIDMSGYSADLTMVRAKAALLDGENVEQVLAALSSDITVDIYTPEITAVVIDNTNRVVVAESGAQVASGLEFDALNDNHVVQTLDMTLQGDVTIAGGIDVAEAGNDNGGFETLTINSTGDEVNTITGNIVATNNDLLNVTVNATQDIVIDGSIVFTEYGAADGVADGVDNETATLRLEGAGDITIASLDVTDTDVDTLNIVNNSTGIVNVPGTSPAVSAIAGVDGNGDAQTSSLVISGTGSEMNFGTADDSATDAANESNSGFFAIGAFAGIDASGYAGVLNLGTITGNVTGTLNITGSSGVTTLTLGAANDDNAGISAEAAFIMGTGADVTIDLSDSATGSTVTITEDATLAANIAEDDAGSLTISAETLVIEGNVDFRDLVDAAGNNKLDLSGVSTIELAEGATVQMTDEQFSAFEGTIEGPGTTLQANDALIQAIGADFTDVRGVDVLQLVVADQLESRQVTDALTLTVEQAEATTPYFYDDADSAFKVLPIAANGSLDEDSETEASPGDFRAFAPNVTVIVSGETVDLSDLEGVTTFDLPADTADADLNDLALTVRDEQLSKLETDNSSASSDLLAQLSSLTVEVVVDTGNTDIEGNAITTNASVNFAYDTDAEEWNVTGNAAAIGEAAKGAGNAFDGLLAESASVVWTNVGTTASAELQTGSTADLEAITDVVDTFDFAANLDTDDTSQLVISGFSGNAGDGDTVDLSVLEGASGALVTSLDSGDGNVFALAADAVYLLAANTDLTAANVASDINAGDADGVTEIANGETAYFLMTNAGSTALFQYAEEGTAGVQEAELSLVGTIDAELTNNDVTVA